MGDLFFIRERRSPKLTRNGSPRIKCDLQLSVRPPRWDAALSWRDSPGSVTFRIPGWPEPPRRLGTSRIRDEAGPGTKSIPAGALQTAAPSIRRGSSWGPTSTRARRGGVAFRGAVATGRRGSLALCRIHTFTH